MKLGVYVGSFNPVHIGHTKLVNYLLERKYLDKIIIIPTLGYWNKLDLIDINKRIDMLKFYETDNIIIDTTLNTLKYTYEVLNKLKEMYPKDELNLIIGADNIIAFDKWKNIDEILNNKVLVIPRDGININYYINKFDKKDNFIIVKGFKEVNISSTKIRKILSLKKFDELTSYMNPCVLEYIKKNNLYFGGSNE